MSSHIIHTREHNTVAIRDKPLSPKEPTSNLFTKKRSSEAHSTFNLIPVEGGYDLVTSYFIGIDWIEKNNQAIYVEPKLNVEDKQTDYLAMLSVALKHPDVTIHTDELIDIKFDEPYIGIEQKQDMLTPLLVIHFLNLVKRIVNKGLKKSYYKVTRNLNGRVKGKVLVGATVKQNLIKNRPFHTFCAYEEFGVNGLENRLLKKTLIFVRNYLPLLGNTTVAKSAKVILNYVNPAFELVSPEVNIKQIKGLKINAFYHEYTEAIRLSKLILKRFGYNLNNTSEKKIIKTPPFWIDMSKLFELYVLGLLKDRFGKGVTYHFKSYWNELDYLLKSNEYNMVVDAKYKTVYKTGFRNEDLRQLSGYARLKTVYDHLGKNYNEVIDCLIVYPDQSEGFTNLFEADLKKGVIKHFTNFYKIPVKLPLI